jgi:type I restriction enzyme R subunit
MLFSCLLICRILNELNLYSHETLSSWIYLSLEQIIKPDVFKTSKTLRETHTFEREDGTPLHYTLINIKDWCKNTKDWRKNTKDWCKNTFEVVNQLRINTKNSFHRYDVTLLLNGLPLVQIELKSLQIDFACRHRYK